MYDLGEGGIILWNSRSLIFTQDAKNAVEAVTSLKLLEAAALFLTQALAMVLVRRVKALVVS
jgi:hypothetical protein